MKYSIYIYRNIEIIDIVPWALFINSFYDEIDKPTLTCIALQHLQKQLFLM